MNEQEFPRFKFFIVAYSTGAVSYTDILEIIQDFKDYESDAVVEELIAELMEIKNNSMWKETQEFIIDHVIRKYDLEKVERFINDMLTILKQEKSEEL
jgi:uncharacterized protein YejL (UPF0352 family)